MKIFICTLSLLLSTKLFAHGEDKFGPNKGYIRMPSTYHTELVPQNDGNFLVFLYDLQNKNPKTQDSSVDLRVKDSKSETIFKCAPMDEHFMCSNDKKINISSDAKVILKTKRLGIKAPDAVYELPLRLEKAKKSSNNHDMNKM
ncbi:MAG: hypothetical protein WC635_17340 [Bacteriovorax sp.]|jgi:hypothetical protein